ncbi:MAG: rRNA pseudouridine synthase [Deltaproteobacteria bacterium]|nr:MAG: rRNA pseudouridine synthase [Deltaproteobacteria bacterium]
MAPDREGERLQKVLARAGVASRRGAERLILEGRVSVNGRIVTELGTRVHPRAEVRVDGRPILEEERVYLLFYKPPQMITSLADPAGRPCVGDVVRGLPARVFPVGRLDWDAEGLLLLTNDGELAHRLMHPRFGVSRVYDAKVKGNPSEATLARMVRGVRLSDGMARPLRVERVGRARTNTWIRIEVAEGRPHLVKRLCEAVGHPVQRLRRIEYAGIGLGGLSAGEMRELSPQEERALKAQVHGRARRDGLPARQDAARQRGGGRGGERRAGGGEGRRPGGGGGAPGRRAPGRRRKRKKGDR